MGALFSRIFSFMRESSDEGSIRILMLGLDSAGKTTILYKLKNKKADSTLPTIGFNVETISPCKGMQFTVWDVGGQDKFRPLWGHYLEDTRGLFFVLDSCDKERLYEARNELSGILGSEKMNGVPVVILANKQDIQSAMKPEEIAESLNLQALLDGRIWTIESTCALNGEGLVEAMEKMAKLIKQRRKSSAH